MLIAVLAVAITVLTGALSASLAMLGTRWTVRCSISTVQTAVGPPPQASASRCKSEPLAGGFVELGAEDVLVYSAYGAKILSLQPSYARPVLGVGGTHFVP